MKKQLLLMSLLMTTLFSFSQIPVSEREALIDLYTATDGENWTNHTNWDTAEPEGSWFGVTVENIDGADHVKELVLQNNNLVGVIPSSLDAFTELTTLILKGNEFTGVIPNSICNITTLEYLHLGFNPELEGGIPSNIGNLTNLNYISFYGNEITEEIPDSFFNLTQIGVISMGNNQFPNELFDISSFTSLTVLRVNGSLFSQVDLRTGNNTDFTEVDVSNCPNLTCVFVDNRDYSVENWTYIDATATFVETEIDCEALSIPVDERNALIALYNATDGINWVNNENWNSTAPVSIWHGVTVENVSGESHITALNFGYASNNLNGYIPSEIGSLTELKVFVCIANSNLTGNIPPALGNCTKLEQLEFSMCNLEGIIPSSFSNLINLQHLYLGYNQLEGDLPNVFDNMNLMSLELSSNDFTGTLSLTNTNSSFYYLDVASNLISSLDFRNGYNTNISNVNYFRANNNPNLRCVFVDDASYSNSNWTNIDATATFLETDDECAALLTDSEEVFKTSIELYPNPTNGNLQVINLQNRIISKIKVVNVLGQSVLENQQATSLDITNLPNGLYYVELFFMDNESSIIKVIKE